MSMGEALLLQLGVKEAMNNVEANETNLALGLGQYLSTTAC